MRAKALAGGLTCLLLCILAVGCGDDEGDSDGGAGAGAGEGGTSGTAGGGSGGRDTLPDPDGGPNDDAAVTPGDEVEGGPCLNSVECEVTDDGVQLTCVNSGGFGVCARGCTSDADCGDEICDSPYTGLAVDAHCIDLVNVEFGSCGGIETSLCSSEAGLTCFLYPDLPLGVCMTPCTTAAADDAGVSDTEDCKSDQICVTSVLTNGEQSMEGVCGTEVDRGEPCGSDMGLFCGADDICAPDDPAAEEPVLTCHQKCTRADDPCDEGTCQQLRTTFYCR